MTTKELIIFLKERKLQLDIKSDEIIILNNIDRPMIVISRDSRDAIMKEVTIGRLMLLNEITMRKIIEYIETPIELRDDHNYEIKYYWKLKGLGKFIAVNKYFKRSDFEGGWFLGTKEPYNIFTETEFNELKKRLNITAEFEPVEID